MRIRFLFAALLLTASAAAQTVLITGQVLDPTGKPYQNGSGVVALVPGGQTWVFNGTNPVNSPVPIAQLDSSGKFAVTLTNTSLITATPPGPLANWQFSFCSNPGLTNGVPICFTMFPMSLTAPQDITTLIQSQSATLPSSGGGSGTISGVTAGTGLTGGGTSGNVALSLLTTCAPSQVLQWTGVIWACASVGTGNVSTAPVTTQPIVQPINTTFSADSFAFFRYVTPSWNFSQSPAADLSSAGAGKVITLTPCPKGIDTASAANHYIYTVYISTTGTAEAALVTGGSCTGGAASGTIIVTTVNTHSAGYTVSSSTTGIQEAWNDAWVNDSGNPPVANASSAPYVKLSADTNYNVYSSIYMRGRGGILDGAGAYLICSTRDRCVYAGTNNGTPAVNYHRIYNLNGGTLVNQDGAQVSSVAASSGTYTVTTASSHGFVVGDTVDCEYYSQTASQHWVGQAVFPTVGTTLTVQFGSNTFSAGTNTFGFCNILNTFIEDNSDHMDIKTVNIFQSASSGGTFSYGIVNDNDQQLQIDHFSNRASSVLRSSLTNATANFPNGAMVYSRNDQGNNGISYVHNSEFTNVNCGTSGGNGFVVDNTVCQAFPVYGFRYFGGLQPATFADIYQDVATDNALYHAVYGQAVFGQMGYLVQGGRENRIIGAFPSVFRFPIFPCTAGVGATRNYWVIPHVSVGSLVGSPLFVGQATACNSGNITVAWPSIQLQDHTGASIGTLTWDILMTTTGATQAPVGTGSFYLTTPGSPVSGSCNTGGMCTFVDTQAAASSGTIASQNFFPNFWFWPSAQAINYGAALQMDTADTAPGIVSSFGTTQPSVNAQQCTSFGNAVTRTPVWVNCQGSGGASGQLTISQLLTQKDGAGVGPVANSKGRINLGSSVTAPNDLITLQDSNLNKAVSTSGHRASNDAGDMAIGIDASGGLNLRAPTSLSFNLNTIPTGSNWLFKANSSLFSTTVPINSSVGFQIGGLAPLGHCPVGNGTSYVDSSSCGGTTLNVNGSPVASANLNSTTPAAGANGINGTIQNTGANVSVEIVGNGNAGNCLSGTGTYVACSGGLAGLTTGQRTVANTSSTLANSGPTYYTEKLSGANIDQRLQTCLILLPSSGGICDMTAETALPTTSTAANGVISGNGVIVILPPVTITLGSTFFFNITGTNSGLVCLHKWACVIDASNNGSAGTVTLNGTGAYATGIKMIGGRLNKQSGNEIIINGSNNWFWENWLVNPGQDGVSIVNNGAAPETQASVRYNIIDQSGSAAILINNGNNASATTLNDVSFNLTRDANVNFNQNTQGTIGAGCSASNCTATPPTAHLADHNVFTHNIILNQVLGSGDCNNPNFGTLNIASWSGSGTASITFTYSSTQPAGGLPVVGQIITGATFAVSGLNANATITASTTTTVTATYGGTITGSTGTGTITYTPTTGDTGCSEGFQTTDPVWYEQIQDNMIFSSSKEGIAYSGIGWNVSGNYLENCGLHLIGAVTPATSGAIAWEKSSTAQASQGFVGDGVTANNVVVNTGSVALRYGIQFLFTGTSSGPYTMKNVMVANNIVDGNVGSGGFTNGILINTSGLTGGNVTFQNFRVENNNVTGATNAFNPNSYTNITGVARLAGNGLNTSTDTAPVSGDIVCFDTNLQPELDCGTLGTNVLTGVVANQGLAVTGHNLELIQSCTSGQTLQWNSGTSQWACAPGIVTGTTNAVGIYTSSTTFGPSNVPVLNGNYSLCASVTTSVSATPALCLPGVPIDTESSATPAVTGSSTGSTSPNTTRASVFQMTNNTTSTGATIAAATASGFGTNFTFAPMNSGSVIATLTPSTSTINGNAAMKFAGKVAGHNPEGAIWYSDNTNYLGLEILPTDANGFLAAEGFNVATSCTTCIVATSPGAGILHVAGGTQTATSSAVSLTADVSGVLPFANMSQLFVVNAQTATYQVLAADFTGCKTIPVGSGTFTITLVASGSQPASGQCLDIINYGSGVVTVARSGQNINGGTTSLTVPAGSQTLPNGLHVVSDGTNYIAQPWSSGEPCTTTALSLQFNNAGALGCVTPFTFASNTITAAAAGIFDMSAATGAPALKFPAVIGGTILAGTSTAALSAPAVFQNTNSSNNNTSIGLGVTVPGTSTGQIGLSVNAAPTSAAIQEWTTGATWTNGVQSGKTVVANMLPSGALALGTATCTTFGTAGGICPAEGTAPTNVSGAAPLYPDSTTHEYMAATNGSSSFGMMVRRQPGAIRSTGLTGAVTTATLCAASAGACNVAGQYHIHWVFYEGGTACGTPATGGVTFLLTWTDANGTTHSAVSLGMDDASAINAVSQTFHFQATLAAAWASGDFNVDTNGTIIQYATGYTACGVGTGNYALSAVVTRVQ